MAVAAPVEPTTAASLTVASKASTVSAPATDNRSLDDLFFCLFILFILSLS